MIGKVDSHLCSVKVPTTLSFSSIFSDILEDENCEVQHKNRVHVTVTEAARVFSLSKGNGVCLCPFLAKAHSANRTPLVEQEELQKEGSSCPQGALPRLVMQENVGCINGENQSQDAPPRPSTV